MLNIYILFKPLNLSVINFPEHLSSPPVFRGVRACYSIFSFMCTSFVLFLLAIVLSVLLRYADSDYPFDIFKLFCMCEGYIFEITSISVHFWFNLTFIHLTLPTLNHLILIHSIFIYLVTFFTGTYTTRYQLIAIKYLYVSVLCI